MGNTVKVLACVDRSPYADHVADAAAWAAQALEGELELLHVLDRHPEEGASEDHSGALGINAQEVLLTTLAERDQIKSRELRETGRLFLARLRERAQAAGVAQVDVRQRHGDLHDTVAERQKGCALLALGRRGESAQVTHRDLGRNVERLVRAIDIPLLTVTDGFQRPKKALIAFDGGSATRKGVELVSRSPLFRGLEIRVVMAGQGRKETEKQLAWAEQTLSKSGLVVTASSIPGDPETVIAKTIKDESIDLLVMGAYSHSSLRALVLGSKTNELLRSSRVPTLLVR